jgi:hypothetical protein
MIHNEDKNSEGMSLFKEKEKWREDEVQADEEKHLGTVRCRWCKFKQQKRTQYYVNHVVKRCQYDG